MYSSVSNTAYNHLFYDILKMPVSTRNRVSMNAAPNPFQEYLMGVRYIQTKADKVPADMSPASKRKIWFWQKIPMYCPLLTEPQLL